MTEPAEILNRVRHLLARGGRLRGRKVVVTAGGTQEPLDPVRMLTNRSSGKQGFAIAQAALDEGAEVILISGPVAIAFPYGAKRIDVKTAEEMRAAVLAEAAGSDALIMAAAVADFRPADPAPRKLKKSAAPDSIRLERTADILTAVSEAKVKTGRPLVTIGFSAETEDLEINARKKLKAKGLDLIVANEVGRSDSGFETETNRVTLLAADGSAEALPLMEKYLVAEKVIDRLVGVLKDK